MSAKMYRTQERMVAGVCGGLAEHLGVKVGLVRAIMLGASFFFGAGLVFYGWLWLLVPMAGDEARERGSLLDEDGNPRLTLFRPAPGAREESNSNPTRQRLSLGFREVAIGGGLVIAAVVLFGQQSGWNLQLGTLIPLLIIVLGAVLAWMQLDDTRRIGLLSAAKMNTPMALLRLGGGIALVIAGVIVIVAGSGSWTLVWSSVVASLAVLAGVALVLAPWVLKFWREFQSERAGRIRETERAEIAAHLHDSVLQTLALIQKSASSPADVTRLARAQERELREWIYQDAAHNAGALVERVKAVCAEAEDVYGQAVEVVAVGDAELTDRGSHWFRLSGKRCSMVCGTVAPRSPSMLKPERRAWMCLLRTAGQGLMSRRFRRTGWECGNPSWDACSVTGGLLRSLVRRTEPKCGCTCPAKLQPPRKRNDNTANTHQGCDCG